MVHSGSDLWALRQKMKNLIGRHLNNFGALNHSAHPAITKLRVPNKMNRCTENECFRF